MAIDSVNGVITTRTLPIETKDLGHFVTKPVCKSLDVWSLSEISSMSFKALRDAAQLLRTSNTPVAFPTETVYGLGGDATRSDAVKGIYKVKGRPSDNPLIVHVCDLTMLRDLLTPDQTNGYANADPIPGIYKPLIERFWPGPLTILLLNPKHSRLAPEVTAGLKTFGARMPNSPLALSLIKLTGVPIAAPSANASTKPSPTTAEHVLHDLNGRIEVILDGGSCDVGVESTVVDGLCSPPVILRPGGISMDSIRECQGWEGVRKGYKDYSEVGADTPRAPGMKYKHYSPKAKVILAEDDTAIVPRDIINFWFDLRNTGTGKVPEDKDLRYIGHDGESLALPTIGIVRTRKWAKWGGWNESDWAYVVSQTIEGDLQEGIIYAKNEHPSPVAKIVEISLGTNSKSIAHGLFSALRELDKRDVAVIYVEGIKGDGDVAAAIMNRLRKAATEIRAGE
jgi:L-threonylcarbamoyladenylate synthase